MPNYIAPEFRWTNDNERCCRCRRCIKQCGWGALSWENKVVPDQTKCVGCHRCEVFCPEQCITIKPNPTYYRPNANWTVKHRQNV
jgi:heterodisulfide reductase subunit A-like polyferredoxin